MVLYYSPINFGVTLFGKGKENAGTVSIQKEKSEYQKNIMPLVVKQNPFDFIVLPFLFGLRHSQIPLQQE